MSNDTINVNMNIYDIPIIVEQLNKLEQENQQLKEENDKIKIAITENCDLRLEVLKYKEVIEEVREYATNEMRIVNDNEYHKLLQILDKAKGEDND